MTRIGFGRAQNNGSSCSFAKTIDFDAARHKRLYTVGVLAIRGFDTAYQELNRTFSDYLTVTAGQHFDPPIRFEMKPLDFNSMFGVAESRAVDFIHVNPGAFSCIDSEYTAQSLVTQISRRSMNGKVYNLKKFGGVIMTRADNDEVSTIYDLKNKIIAAVSISGLGSGQMEFFEMINAGMSIMNDPKQLVFTGNQDKIVNGVLNGNEFDVGFVRTDQLERSKDADGNPIDTSLFKIINTKANLTVDGEPFPFEASTPLYPEWNVAALSHVSEDVSRQVQDALLNAAEYARVGAQLAECQLSFDEAYCDSLILGNASSCIPREVAMVAADAMTKGKYSGWQTTLSYMDVHFMQEATGFITKDPDTLKWHCVRSTEIYDYVVCPEGYAKRRRQDVERSCAQEGLHCGDGYQCVCSPCVPIEVCDNGATIGSNCVSYAILLPVIFVPLFLLVLVGVHFYVEYNNKQADAVWVVKPDELTFGDPPKVIGQGTFGQVLLAEYRGTQVAVKRVIPPQSDSETIGDESDDRDVEQPDATCDPGLQSMAPQKSIMSYYRLGSLSDARHRKRKHGQLKADFVREMRHLAKLRHPNITTAMGAVVSKGEEPMLIMEYMHNGSLYDAMRNETITLNSHEDILTIVQDIAHGLRFLHSARPQVLHGDLKTKNILIDSNFRAKVADFGLSAKKQVGARGTPYWMAPELLTGESSNSAMSDIYSFGIILYEVYARKNPYEGENYNEVLRLVCDPTVCYRPPVPSLCPPTIALLMQDCLRGNPQDRPSTEQVDLMLRAEGTVQRRAFRIETLNKELVETNRKISSEQATQLEHFACMSHEIRTPLNCIIGISSLMDEDGTLGSSKKESVKMIVSSGKLLRHIVDDVLDYSKFVSGKAEIDIKRTNLQEMLTNLISSMSWSSVTERKQISIRTFYDPLVPEFVETDGRRLQQILYNLLSNAVKFSRLKGKVDLSVSVCSADDSTSDDEEAPLVSRQRSSMLRFDVTDYGKGIEETEFDNIFQPFAQTETGKSNTDGGTGLGLAITKQLVELLGGSISVDSEAGQWAKFTVDLPLTVSVTNTSKIKSRLENCSACLVSDQEMEIQYAVYACEHFQVQQSHFDSLKELDESMESSCPDRCYVCLVQENLYDESVYDKLSKKAKTILITFGSDKNIARAQVHYQSLTRVFPSVLMQKLYNLCKSNASTKMCHTSNKIVTNPQVNFEQLRILVAEDNKVNQKVLVRLLERLGVVHVDVADNGQIAIDLEAAKDFDVVLMDMQMPVMDGLEACKQIVARTATPPKVIFLSAHASDHYRSLCFENGAADYLTKPCTHNDLKEKLEMVVNGKVPA